ncbi:MAG: glycogen synthase GlgA [Acidobacteriota bacterium]
MPPLRIAFVTAEVAPFAKTGGLADVSAALPAHLVRHGHDVRVIMPLYDVLDAKRFDFVPVDYLHHVPVRLGDAVFHFSAFTARLPDTEVDVYFIGCPTLYDRGAIYTGARDDHLRFAFLAKAALVCCQHMGFSPDILHANDWHAALAPLYAKTVFGWDRERFGTTRSVLTIHNLAYQGRFPADTVPNLGLHGHAHELHQDHLRDGWMSFLETGILHADAITTVSGTYARQIQTPAYGEGLDGLLRQRSSSVVGIVNGIDETVWNPETDPDIPWNYGPETVAEGKAECKRHLLEELGLPYDPKAPVLGIVSRLTVQKGFEITHEPLVHALRHRDLRVTVLGSGERELEEHFSWLQRTFPDKVCFYRGYHEELAHWIEAGADIFLMPSRFEPCGLNQMYSLKYGTVPIVHKTGGLADTVRLFDPATGEGTGFVFDHFDTSGFAWALKAALDAYDDPETWSTIQQNGMAEDFSWTRQGAIYEQLYERLLRLPRS